MHGMPEAAVHGSVDGGIGIAAHNDESTESCVAASRQLTLRTGYHAGYRRGPCYACHARRAFQAPPGRRRKPVRVHWHATVPRRHSFGTRLPPASTVRRGHTSTYVRDCAPEPQVAEQGAQLPTTYLPQTGGTTPTVADILSAVACECC